MGSMMKSNQKSDLGVKMKKFSPLIVLILIFASFFIFGLDEYLTFQALSDNRDKLLGFVEDHYLIALLAYFVIYTISVAASVPGGLLLTITGGFLFGWVVGGFITVCSATVGATIIYMVAATSLGDALKQKAGPWLKRLEGGFKNNAMSYLLFLRLVPAFPFWLVNIAPAFLGVPFKTYVIGTFIGIIPGTFVFAFLGTGLDSIILEQQEKFRVCEASGNSDCVLSFNFSSLITTEIILSFVALGVISLIPVVLKRFRKSRI